MTKTTLSRVSLSVLALAVLLALATSGTALPFSGSPLINYGQRFYIYSDVWASYCQLYPPGGVYGIRCDIGLTTTTGATKFYINGTGCGPIPSSAKIVSSLIVDSNGMYCTVREPTWNPYLYMGCGSDYFTGYEMRFNNTQEQPDGLLHGGTTPVLISSTSNGAAGGICSAQPMWQDQGYIECDRAIASTWENFYLVPA